MGVTIKSKNHNIDMGYGSFFRLRCLIADEASKDIGMLYRQIIHAVMSSQNIKQLEIDSEYVGLWKKYNNALRNTGKDLHLLNNFLLASDAGGKRSWRTCLLLKQLLEHTSNDIKIGYAGWGKDCATIGDFKGILQDCIDNHSYMIWY